MICPFDGATENRKGWSRIDPRRRDHTAGLWTVDVSRFDKIGYHDTKRRNIDGALGKTPHVP